MTIDIGTMNIFHIVGFAVNNHTIGLVGIISNIKQFTIHGTPICKIFQTSNTGEQIQRSSPHITWVPAAGFVIKCLLPDHNNNLLLLF